MLRKPNGDFSFEKISLKGSFEIKVSAIGYAPYSKGFTFLSTENKDSVANAQKDLGNIIMNREHEKLAAVTIVRKEKGSNGLKPISPMRKDLFKAIRVRLPLA